MLPEEMAMHCTICGVPIVEPPGWNGPAKWLHCAIVLGPKGKIHEDGSAIIEIPATNLCGPYFELEGTKQRITACDNDCLLPDHDPKPPLYIPTHVACIQIAHQLTLQDNRHGYEPDSLSHIWRVLKARFVVQRMTIREAKCKLDESHDYYSEDWRFREEQWEGGWNEEADFEAQHFKADPVLIPTMTESILSHLTPIHQEVHHTTSTLPSQKPSLSLPPLPSEILHHIMEQLHPFSDPPLSCNLLIPPSYWRQALMNGALIPWLWDLDAQAVMKKESELQGDDEWNWELLARQLAQVNIHEPRKVLEDLPMGLRNRRRIWRLVGDIMATEVKESG